MEIGIQDDNSIPIIDGFVGCCCGPQCSSIITSLCSDELVQLCGYGEIDDGTEPTCPPKFYRVRTETWFGYGTQSNNDSPPNEPTDQFTQNYSYSYEEVKEQIWDEEGGFCYEEVTKSGSMSNNMTFWEADPYSCSATYDQETDSWTPSDCSGGNPTDPFFDWGFSWQSVTEVRTKTSIIKTYTYSTNDTWPSGSRTREASLVHTVTLSEPQTLREALINSLCSEEPCTPNPEDPECRPCCTDGSSGRKLSETEGCLIPGNSPIAWDSTACSETTGRKKGQSSVISIVMKGLTPGTQYRLILHYSRCELAKDEDDEYIVPSCGGGSCAEGDPELFTEEMLFEATDWAEILAYDCGACDISYRKCELEDEAAEWNADNPEATPRTVACTTGGFNVPVANNYLTRFEGCELEEVEEEP